MHSNSKGIIRFSQSFFLLNKYIFDSKSSENVEKDPNARGDDLGQLVISSDCLDFGKTAFSAKQFSTKLSSLKMSCGEFFCNFGETAIGEIAFDKTVFR